LILASASPRRRALMRSFPYPVRVRPSSVPEPNPRRKADPGRWALDLARRKALAVARAHQEALVLGADTVVALGTEIFGKPTSPADARRILKRLAGSWHTVHTGLCLAARPGRKFWTVIWSTRVKMRALTDEELEFWSRKNHDKAGGYAVQAKGDPFVERLRGDYDNVVGLPRKGVRLLLARARRAGFHPI